MKLSQLLEAKYHKGPLPEVVYEVYKSIEENESDELHPDILFDEMQISFYDATFDEQTNTASVTVMVPSNFHNPTTKEDALIKFKRGLEYVEQNLGGPVPYTSMDIQRQTDDWEELSVWEIKLRYQR